MAKIPHNSHSTPSTLLRSRMRFVRICHYTSASWDTKTILDPSGWWTTMSSWSGGTCRVVGRASTIRRHRRPPRISQRRRPTATATTTFLAIYHHSKQYLPGLQTLCAHIQRHTHTFTYTHIAAKFLFDPPETCFDLLFFFLLGVCVLLEAYDNTFFVLTGLCVTHWRAVQSVGHYWSHDNPLHFYFFFFFGLRLLLL